MTVEVILNIMAYLRIHNVSIHINFYQNRFINECVRIFFLNSRKDRRKDGNSEFFVRCRRTYVLNNLSTIIHIKNVPYLIVVFD